VSDGLNADAAVVAASQATVPGPESGTWRDVARAQAEEIERLREQLRAAHDPLAMALADQTVVAAAVQIVREQSARRSLGYDRAIDIALGLIEEAVGLPVTTIPLEQLRAMGHTFTE
jgi:hypothetical protein